MLEYKAGGNPKLTMLSPCNCNEESLSVEIEFLVDMTLLGRFMAGEMGRKTESVRCAPAPVDRGRVPASASVVFLKPNWRSELQFVDVFPVPASVKASMDADAKRMAKGLKSIIPEDKPAQRPSLRIKYPKPRLPSDPGGELSGSDMESGSNAGSGGGTDISSDSDGGGEGPVQLPGPIADPAVDAVGSEGVILRASQPEPFGCWSVSRIRAKGVHVGWGANCHKHLDAGHRLECKKSFANSRHSLDELKCLAKQWLLMGLEVPQDSATARTEHVRDIHLEDIELRSEAELDAEALARAPA
jgi:hypothetical protein